MDKKLLDTITGYIPVVSDILLLRYPMATILSVIYGLASYALVHLFKPLLQKPAIANVADFVHFPWYSFVILFLAICITAQMRWRKLEPLPKPIEQAVQAIELGVRSGTLTPVHARHQYDKIVTTMVEQLDMKEEYKREAETMKALLMKNQIEASPKSLDEKSLPPAAE